MTSVHVRVHGVVQGVGFRWFTRDAAVEHGVTGWVRNRVDGTVEAELHGAPATVQAVLAAMRTGPPHARVDELRIEPRADAEHPPLGFDLRPTA